jgi:hypothetical protein
MKLPSLAPRVESGLQRLPYWLQNFLVGVITVYGLFGWVFPVATLATDHLWVGIPAAVLWPPAAWLFVEWQRNDPLKSTS